MKKNYKSRCGYTLAELSIVLAVIAIVSTMVVSFSVLVSRKNRTSQQRLDALTDIQVVEAITENWIELNYPNVSVSQDDLSLKGNTGKSIYFDKENSLFYYSDGKSIKLETVKSIVFDSVSNDSSGDTIYFCKIEYSVANKPETYTFCVNPYVGESGGN